LASQHDADLAPVVAELREQAVRVIIESDAPDLVVGGIPLAQLVLHDVARPRVIVDEKQDWGIWHEQHPM
jgi:hypothetical protein